jgi:hypothetical protein
VLFSALRVAKNLRGGGSQQTHSHLWRPWLPFETRSSPLCVEQRQSKSLVFSLMLYCLLALGSQLSVSLFYISIFHSSPLSRLRKLFMRRGSIHTPTTSKCPSPAHRNAPPPASSRLLTILPNMVNCANSAARRSIKVPFQQTNNTTCPSQSYDKTTTYSAFASTANPHMSNASNGPYFLLSLAVPLSTLSPS